MKIEIKNYGNTYSVETETDDLEISEVIEIITGLLIQLGYQQESINEAIKELADGSN
jgi:Holliday junction resolvasome RuvABC DNA-binding subunit